jgi:hypothetical protein
VRRALAEVSPDYGQREIEERRDPEYWRAQIDGLKTRELSPDAQAFVDSVREQGTRLPGR